MSVDECGFNLETINMYGYAPKGEKIEGKTYPKGPNTSLLLIISPDGIEGFIIYEGGLTSKMWDYFLVHVVRKLKDNNILNNAVIILDNAKPHYSLGSNKTK